MGWTSYDVYGSIDRLAECRKEFSRSPDWATIVKDAMVEKVYYAAMKSSITGEVWALVVLTDIYKGQFFYKDMSEDMEPYYYKCPDKILDLLSPTENEYALRWRERCRICNKRKS